MPTIYIALLIAVSVINVATAQTVSSFVGKWRGTCSLANGNIVKLDISIAEEGGTLTASPSDAPLTRC